MNWQAQAAKEMSGPHWLEYTLRSNMQAIDNDQADWHSDTVLWRVVQSTAQDRYLAGEPLDDTMKMLMIDRLMIFVEWSISDEQHEYIRSEIERLGGEPAMDGQSSERAELIGCMDSRMAVGLLDGYKSDPIYHIKTLVLGEAFRRYKARERIPSDLLEPMIQWLRVIMWKQETMRRPRKRQFIAAEIARLRAEIVMYADDPNG